jgi:uncharacterized protein (DUF433 family)
VIDADASRTHISRMITRYRPDPENPRRLTEEEARALDETPIDYSDIPPMFDDIDWSQCPEVESVPGRCSGAWVVKDSRVIVESCILDNTDAGATPEEIADWFEVPGGVDVVRRILRFAYQFEVTAIIGPAEPPFPPMTPETRSRLDTLTRRLRELRKPAR